MGEAKFTKGDWEIEIGCSQVFVATENKFIHEGNIDFTIENREERLCNAHLIKAAPKMYAEIESDIELIDEQMRFKTENDEMLPILISRRGKKLALLAEARGENA